MKRPNTIRVDASSVQGEGAYITWKRLTWGERKSMIDEWTELKDTDERIKFVQEVMLSQIVGWNWVNDRNEALPLPASLDDFDALYPEETDFLYAVAEKAIRGRLAISENDLKN